MNQVSLVGRLTKDPELRYMPGSGTPVASFNLAIDRDYKKKDGTVETDFIPIQIIGKSAEYCANYLEKGRLVALNGSIRVENYKDQEGNNRIFTKVSSTKVEFLGYGKDKSNEPQFEPQGTQGFQAVDDDDIPF